MKKTPNRTKTPNLIRECKDPHHNGSETWGFDGYDFWIRSESASKWTKVRRSHITPARALMFHYLVTGVKPVSCVDCADLEARVLS